MTHVITRACCNDAACVSVCPKNCIHPRPGDPDFATAEMLRIDPVNCIDCGACVEVCPVSAIVPDFMLRADQSDYLGFNADFFAGRTYEVEGFREEARPVPVSGLTVGVVGSGPAAMYAVEQLLEAIDESCEIHVYERLPVPWGLVRFGVAPDHQDTKQVTRGFERIATDPRVRFHLNVEVGTDITHEQLAASHHAVVYGIGAPSSRALGIPGENLPGSIAATDFVAWYNGHPDSHAMTPDLTGRRAVIIGNGNVALDVARILAAGDVNLEESDIAGPAQEALAGSAIEEIVVLARRGPEDAAYTTPELLSLVHHPDLEVRVEGVDGDTPRGTSLKAGVVTRIAEGEFARAVAKRRVVLRFMTSPVEIVGTDRATGVVVTRNEIVRSQTGARAVPTDETERIDAGLIIRAVGYAGTPIAGLPFDEKRALIPNAAGRVTVGGDAVPGSYVVGWSKRGPSGVIGTNKSCARETVEALLTDARSGRLPSPAHHPNSLVPTLPEALGLDAWHRVDAAEKQEGRRSGRPRVKITERSRLVDIGRERT